MVGIRNIFILLRIKNRNILDNSGNDVFYVYLDTCSYGTKLVVRFLKINFFVGYSVIKGKTFVETGVFLALLRS